MVDKSVTLFFLARRAYEHFYNLAPEIGWEHLSHTYQQRWMDVVEALGDHTKAARKAMGKLGAMALLNPSIVPEPKKKKKAAPRRFDFKAFKARHDIPAERRIKDLNKEQKKLYWSESKAVQTGRAKA